MTKQALDAETIRTWLQNNPDFLVQHPEVLDSLQVPQGDDSVTSLIAFQNKRLIEQNNQLKLQLKNLSGIAGQNEKLMQRVHRLTLNLANTDNLAELIDQLEQAVLEDFKADAVRLLMLQRPDHISADVPIIELAKEQPEWLEKLLAKQTPFCGRLTKQKREHLLGADADRVLSAALVPLGDLGILLIGAKSADRFHPGMGTLFLDLLGETVRLRLEALIQPQPSRRSA